MRREEVMREGRGVKSVQAKAPMTFRIAWRRGLVSTSPHFGFPRRASRAKDSEGGEHRGTSTETPTR